MTPAKPQQMTGQQDNPDDLIAELTKLMALEARPSADRDKPAPIPSAPPVAALPQRPAPATIRIPGVEQPLHGTAPDSAQAHKEPAAEAGRSNVVAANWPRENATPQNAVPQNAAPQSAPPAAEPPPPATSHDSELIPSFEFDFGFNRQRPEALPRSAMPVSPARPGAPVAPTASALGPVDRDPIAELIAAELKGVIGQPGPSADPEQRAATPAIPAPLPAPSVPQAAKPTANPVATPTPSESQRVAPQPRPAVPAPIQQAAPPVASTPAPRVPGESDRFATAPVFGLGNRPAGEAPVSKPVLDPIDEIESLIGEAVRVELGAPSPAPRPAAAPSSARTEPGAARPVVPPLSNNFTPRRTPSLRETEAATAGADEAILAATAAATGSARIDAPFEERFEAPPRKARRERAEREDRQEEREQRSGGAFRQFVVPVIAGVVLVAIGFGLYWGLGMGHHDGDAPVLTADATPAKTIPPKPADTTPHSVVMDQLSGTTPAPSAETLVSRDQTQGPDGTTQVAAAAPAPAADDASLANRKVRTVTVRPDGTIISGDDSVAGGTALPVDRPNVPAVPGISVANANEPAPAATPSAPVSALANAPSIDTSGVPSDDPIAAAIANAAPDVTGAAPAAPQQTAAAEPADIPAPTPMPRSMRPEAPSAADNRPQPASAVNAVVASNNAAAAKPLDLVGGDAPAAPTRRPAAPVTMQPASSGGAVAHVQLASQPSEAAAQSTAGSLQKRFGSLLNGAKLSVVRADLGAKGVYYRVVVPTSSLGDAQQLCATIKSNGGDCVAANG